MARRRALFATLLAASALAACSVIARDDADSAESAHTEGAPTFAQYSWQWADETEEEFEKNAARNAWETPEYLPADHPMTQRLQYWIDRMDDFLRASYPDKLKATPKPKVSILKSSDTNAWVSFLPVSWKVSTRLLGVDAGGGDGGGDDAGDGGSDGGSVAPPAEVFFLSRNGSVDKSSERGFERPTDPTKLGELSRFFSSNFAQCRVSVVGEELVLGEGCHRPAHLGVKRAERFSYYATAKHVTFTSGYILELLDEDRVITTLAHELGHYYRSHANMPTDVVNFFYSLDELTTHKPAPDPRFIEQTAKAREKLREDSWGINWSEENKLMAEQRLGFYTIEQEADEIALELVSKVGVPPGVAVDKILTVLKAAGNEGEGTIPWAECSMLREAGFRDADGKPVSVPVGDPDNAHHNLCFRVFNMTREIAAHRYKVAPRPTPPGEPWSRLLTRLGQDVDPPPPPPPPPLPPPADGGAPNADLDAAAGRAD